MALEYDSILISPQGHRIICQAVFRRIGMSEPCADAISDSLLFADLRGTNSHGISRIKQYTDNARSGYFDVKGEPEIIGDRGGTLHINGHNGYGAHVSTFAMQKAIERAQTTGIAFCVVNQSTHFGAAAYFAMMALPCDCIGLALSNGVPAVAHHGANRAQTGTNPLAIAFPAQRHRPYVLDMATSVAASGNIINCAREGKPIPSGWACDSQGQPTNDAKQALQGYCLPLGGYKGSGIALAIDMLCGLLGGGPTGRHIMRETQLGPDTIKNGPGISHVFAVINIAFYRNPIDFKESIDAFIDELKNAPVAPGFEQILVAGEPEFIKYEQYSQQGIPIAKASFAEICAVCRSVDVAVDPADYILA